MTLRGSYITLAEIAIVVFLCCFQLWKLRHCMHSYCIKLSVCSCSVSLVHVYELITCLRANHGCENTTAVLMLINMTVRIDPGS